MKTKKITELKNLKRQRLIDNKEKKSNDTVMPIKKSDYKPKNIGYNHKSNSQKIKNDSYHNKNQSFKNKNPEKRLPPSLRRYDFGEYKNEKLKIMVLGGLEEVGRNMTVLEYKNEIIIIDMGVLFPGENMPGIDYVIPDISYLKNKSKKIKGVIITHGHYDHIGAIPHLIPELGNPQMYMAKLTAGLVKKRQEDFKNNPPLKINIVDENSKIRLGNYFRVELFKVNHTIPDSFGLAIYTPVGLIVHTGDFKIDYTPMYGEPTNLQKFAYLSSQGVLALMIDSTNSELPGYQLSEAAIAQELDRIIGNAKGRVITGTFASLINRLQLLMDIAYKHNRKIVFEGRTMKNNVDIAHELGYLKIKPGQEIMPEKAETYPDNKLLIMGTGAQAQERSFLMRYANNEHKYFSVKPNDTVIFSSSVIPGNERTVQCLRDNLAKKDAEVIHYKMLDVHAGGHAKAEDIKLMFRLIKPRYVIPIEAHHYMLKETAKIAESVGIHNSRIFVANNGQIMEFARDKAKLTNKYVPVDYVYVDGLGVTDTSQIVLRDRTMMAKDGMFVVIATIDSQTGNLVGSPDIISRGFIYMKENKKLIQQTREKVKKILKENVNFILADEMFIKSKIRNEIGQFLYRKTKKRPMVLPVLIEV
jgi:ribonuclease J